MPLSGKGFRRKLMARLIQRRWRGYKSRAGKLGAPRLGSSIRTGFLTVQQKVLDTSFTLPAGPNPTGIIQKYKFKAADVTQWTTFASLFDQYRITGIKMTFLPTTSSDPTQNQSGTFAFSIDLDGDNNITTFPTLLECSNAHTSAWSGTGGLTPYKKIFLNPRCHDAVITDIDATGQPSAINSGLANRKQWLDVSDRGLTQHYGVNVGWYFGANGDLNVPQELQVIITYYLQFRKVR